MLTRMNTNTVIWLVVAIVLIIGGYIGYTQFAAAPAQGTQQQATSTPPTDQVQAQDTTVGTGETATPGARVAVLYVGQLQDGTVFDSSQAHGNQPLTFVLGEPGLIPGFQIGVNGMKVGGERVMAIPPSLGYGDQPVRENPEDPSSKIVIPANSTIIFTVRLVDVQPATTTPAAAQ